MYLNVFIGVNSFSPKSMVVENLGHLDGLGRRGWDGGKHRSPGIPPIPPYQIPATPKRYFAKTYIKGDEQLTDPVYAGLFYKQPRH